MHDAETDLTHVREASPVAQYASETVMSHLPLVFLLHTWTDALLLLVGY